MSKIFEKSETYSSNMDNVTIESEIQLNNFYSKITSKYNKKNKFNIFNRRQSNQKIYRKLNSFHNFSRENINYSKSTTDETKTKTKFIMKENKENQVNSLIFNNSFLREKQKKYRLNSVKIKNHHIYLNCDKQNNTYNTVNNDVNMYEAFLSQTKSNFNNKYKIIYAISDWRDKEKVNNLFSSIKKYKNKYNFSNYLENKRCLSAKKIKINNKLTSFNNINNNLNKIILLSNQSNNFLNNLYHKSNLIKIKSLNNINDKNLIFDTNNTFFKTLPINNKNIF